jgi:hypothetical protein
VRFNEILFIALGCGYAAVGLLGLGKFAGQLLHPPDEENRRARLPVALMMGRCLGVGGGFMAFGLTHSWIALGFGVALSISDVAIARWTLRRLGESLD